jgi:hypothetical protein
VVLASDAIKSPKEVMIGVGDLVLDTIEASRTSIAAILKPPTRPAAPRRHALRLVR